MLRREFLQAATTLPLFAGSIIQTLCPQRPAKSCILLVLAGGPSHLDTWDMKPGAPREIRGPFRPIRTNVPGIEISEIFPRMARHADKYALIRSVYHDSPAIHETGLQLMPVGVIVPCALGNMGCGIQPETRRIVAGDIDNFEENCRTARRLVESGTRFVTVNMFDTVFNKPTWDAHGVKPFSTLADYRTHVGPAFDRGFSTLIQELADRGQLESTLVVATGEFGRSPRINPAGGRDHWPRCWTVVMAGGGIQGGQIYGSSDPTGAEPRDNPVSFSEIAAMLPGHAVGERHIRSAITAATAHTRINAKNGKPNEQACCTAQPRGTSTRNAPSVYRSGRANCFDRRMRIKAAAKAGLATPNTSKSSRSFALIPKIHTAQDGANATERNRAISVALESCLTGSDIFPTPQPRVDTP